MQCSGVTTQFGLMIEPPHMCDPEYRSDTWNFNVDYQWTELGWTTVFIWSFHQISDYKYTVFSAIIFKKYAY